MSVELRPLGVACNIQCQYCYQNPQRDAGNVPRAYDIDAMKAATEREGGPFTMFGGEALLVPAADLEELFRWGLEQWGSNGIQTNGVLINDEHVRMFKAYKVHVGVSIDGPGELNDSRWAGTLDRTREATAKIGGEHRAALRRGHPPSMIVTLHRGNATADKLPRMHDWFRELERMGVRSARLHVLEVDEEGVGAAYALSTDENLGAFRSFAALEGELDDAAARPLPGHAQPADGRTTTGSTCVWNACDPYTTRAVRGVEGFGQASNCGRTNKDGIDFVKSSQEGFERYLALYQTPQEHGGCRDCRFFLQCKGQCPGTSIDGDWRNRTEHCELWKGLFRTLEEQMLDAGEVPVSASPERATSRACSSSCGRAAATRRSPGRAASWSSGRRAVAPRPQCSTPAAMATSRTATPTPHGDAPHGDRPHGDA